VEKEKEDRLAYLEKLIGSPEIENFLEGVRIEAAHQTDKWGMKDEESKFPHDYALVMDRLKGKQTEAIWTRDSEKYRHHLVTLAAVCFNAHRQVSKEGTAIFRYFSKK